MNSQALKSNACFSSELKVGHFSKKEASQLIANGFLHIHSTPDLFLDPHVKMTQRRIQGGPETYQWEIGKEQEPITIASSETRHITTGEIITKTEFSRQTLNRDRLNVVLEELLSNSFYHSIKDVRGTDFFDRQQGVTLSKEQAITIRFAENESGIYLAVSDQGGSLLFSDLSKRLTRFFSKNDAQVTFDSKHSGAGLGLSLVFQMSTHLSIEVIPHKKTTISVWITKNKIDDPNFFSFNYFEV